jgi:WD40 repeat protein
MSKNIEKHLNSKEKQILNFTNNKNSDFSLIEINKNMNKIFGNSTSESRLKEKKKKKKLEKIPLLKINSIGFQNILKDSLTLDDLRIKYNLRDIPVKRKEGFIPKNKYINTLIELQIFNFGDSPIWVMKISENGKYLAAGNKMGKIRIYEIMGYDYPNYENIYNNKNIMNYLYFINEKPIKEFSEHKKDITDLSWSKFKFNYLLSSSIDNYVILWDIIKKPNCKGKFKHDDYVTCIQFSPTDENIFITGCFNKSIRIYNINDIIKKSKDKLKETISKTPTKNYGDILIQDKITSMSFFPDGTQIAIGTFNGKIYVYDFNVNTGRYNHNFTCRNRVGKNSLGKKVTSITFLNKKNAIISTCDSSVRMISMLDGKNLSKYKGNVNENGMIRTDIDFSNDVIISGSEDGSCYTWKILAEEDKYLKNYNYESFKPFERDVVECSIIVNEECFINYMKKVLNFTNKINIISMFINSTDNGKIEVLLNINEDII